MLRKQGWLVVLGGLVVGVSGASARDDSGALDNKLEERVESRLKTDTRLDDINVDVSNGMVTLTGEVANRAERARAEKLARAEGAKRVTNKLEIDNDKAAAAIDERAKERKEQVDARAEKQKEAIDRQAAAAKEKLERASTTEPARPADKDRPIVVDRDPNRPSEVTKVARNVGDAWVTTKVKTKIMADDLLDQSEINVDTDAKGVVTLGGTVPSEAARNRAVEIARTTEGVRQVVDKLVVGAPVTK